MIQHFKLKVYSIQIIQKIMSKSASGFDHLMKEKKKELELPNRAAKKGQKEKSSDPESASSQGSRMPVTLA